MRNKLNIAKWGLVIIWFFVAIVINQYIYPKNKGSWVAFIIELVILIISCVITAIDSYLKSEQAINLSAFQGEALYEVKLRKNRLIKKILLIVVSIGFLYIWGIERINVIYLYNSQDRLASWWLLVQIILFVMISISMAAYYNVTHKYIDNKK